MDTYTGYYVSVDDYGCAVPSTKQGYWVLENVMKFDSKKGYGIMKIFFRGKE